MNVHYIIENHSFEKVSTFQESILEFSSMCDLPEDISFRGSRLNGIVISAKDRDSTVGILFGYEEKHSVWYNHITAVTSEYRKQGIATALINEFEKHAIKQGATRVTVKSMNRFPNMLRRLIGLKYQIAGIEGEKIMFSKKCV